MTVEYKGKVVGLSLDTYKTARQGHNVYSADVEFITQEGEFPTAMHIRIDDNFQKLVLGQPATITVVL